MDENIDLYLAEYYEIIESMFRQLISIEETNSISQTAILQIGTLLNGGIELVEHFLEFSDNEVLSNTAEEFIVFFELILERMLRAYERCSLVTDSNNDVLVYRRAFNYIIDMMMTNLVGITENENIEEYYIDAMMIYSRAAINLSRNALRFRLCRELIDILREVIIFASTMLQKYQNININ